VDSDASDEQTIGSARRVHWIAAVGRAVALAAVVVIAVCSVLIVNGQNDRRRLARLEACYARAQTVASELGIAISRIPPGVIDDATRAYVNEGEAVVESAVSVCDKLGSGGLPAIPSPPPTTTTIP